MWNCPVKALQLASEKGFRIQPVKLTPPHAQADREKIGGSLNCGSIGPQSRIQHDIPIILSLCDGSLENRLK